MAFYEANKRWRPDVGGEEEGIKTWAEYHVEIEYIEHNPEDINKEYYMRWSEWFGSKKEALEFIRDFKHPIRQAWIDKIVTTKTREKYLRTPNNIKI